MQQWSTAISNKISQTIWTETEGQPFTNLASQATSAIGLIDELRSLGAELFVELPTIVFIGKQSAGKSSLVEALTRITLPRNDSTCTRCPIDVRTKTAKTWSCSVTLRWHRNKDIKVELFKELKDPSQVEDTVRNAQLTLLNPRRHFDEKLEDSEIFSDDFSHQLQFTRDTVCVNILGPDVGNISLIDLPGLIQYTEKEKDGVYIKLVEQLALEYITKPHTIIVACISCKDDIENQSVKALAAKVDRSGTRTLGVLTKPDAIEAGCHEKWIDIVSGSRHKLKLGWHVVKNPNKQQLATKPTFEQSRKDEQQYFTETYPWNEMDNSRVGCIHLLRALGHLLEFKINEQLPKIREIVMNKLEKATSLLQSLPQPIDPKSVKLRLHDMVNSFAEELRRVIDSDVANTEEKQGQFWQSIVCENQDFRQQLVKTQPQFELLQGRDDFQNHVETQGPLRSLTDVQKLIPETLGRHLPVTGYGAVTVLVKEFTSKWEFPSVKYVQQVTLKLQRMVAELVNRRFGGFPKIQKVVSEELRHEISRLERITTEKVKHIVALEQTHSTVHTRELGDLEDHYLHLLRSALHPELSPTLSQQQMKKMLSDAATKDGMVNVDDLLKKLSPLRCIMSRSSEEEKALRVIADVCAYWKISYMRFSDYVPKTIDNVMLSIFASNCRSVLTMKLNILHGDDSKLIMLLQEDSSVVQKRKNVSSKVEKLTRIMHKLNCFTK